MAGFGGTYTTGIVLANPTTQNPATITASGYVGNGGDAVYGVVGTAWTVANAGRIISTAGGYGIRLATGGNVANVQGGTIQGKDGIGIGNSGGTVVNAGTVAGIVGPSAGVGIFLGRAGSVVNMAGGAVIGSFDGIVADGYAAVANYGTIADTASKGIGIALLSGGTLTNSIGGTIVGGSDGALLSGGTGGLSGNVLNDGTIIATGTDGVGLLLSAPGGLVNQSDGIIAGTEYGVVAIGTPSITNAGTIVANGAAGTGLILDASAAVANSGLVSGITGVVFNATGVVLNHGTIAGTGGTAVAFATGQFDRLILYPGAVLAGGISNFTVDDNIDFVARMTDGYRFSGGVLTLTNGASVVAQLTVATPYPNPHFLVTPDGAGGTTLMLATPENLFSGTYAGGIVLNTPSAQNPATVTATGNVANGTAKYGGDAVYGTNAAAWTLVNSGTIAATRPLGHGVRLIAGGLVANGRSGSSAGLIAGYQAGIETDNAAGTLVNFGTVASTGSGFGTAVDLAAGGTVANYGLIAAPGGGDIGVVLAAPGVIANGTRGQFGALIAGSATGVDIAGSGGTLVNFGTVESTNAVSGQAVILSGGGTVSNFGSILEPGSAGIGVELVNGGVVDNGSGASIAGGTGVAILGTTGTVVNFGTISGTGGTAVAFGGGADLLVVERGAVFNGALAGFGPLDTIDLAQTTPTNIAFSAGTLTVFSGINVLDSFLLPGTFASSQFALSPDGTGGTDIRLGSQIGAVFSGTYSHGVVLSDPAAQNPATVTATGNIANDGVALLGEAGFAWTLSNSGTVAGTGAAGIGVELDAGGSILNGTAAGGAAAALITGVYSGIDIFAAAGTVTNYGTVASTGAGYADGIYFGAAGALANFGTIAATASGYGIGVDLAQGGTVGNAAGAAILGNFIGLGISGAAGTVANYGTIGGAGYGVVLASGGSLVNQAGALVNAAIGVYLTGAGDATVVNDGTISGQYGLAVGYGDSATNTVIINAGTIIGSSAALVFGGGGDDVLVVEPGAVFVGLVYAGSRADMLELGPGHQEAGTLVGLGSSFAGFGTVRVDGGAAWAIAGASDGAPVVNDGTIAVEGGTRLTLGRVFQDEASRGVVAVGNGSVVTFAGAVAARQQLVFTGGDATARLVHPAAFSASIDGFAAGAAIDLVNTAADGLFFLRGRLTVTEAGTPIAVLRFAGHHTTADFTLAPDGHGGTAIGFASGAAATGLAQPASPAAPSDPWTLHG